MRRALLPLVLILSAFFCSPWASTAAASEEGLALLGYARDALLWDDDADEPAYLIANLRIGHFLEWPVVIGEFAAQLPKHQKPVGGFWAGIVVGPDDVIWISDVGVQGRISRTTSQSRKVTVTWRDSLGRRGTVYLF